MIDCSSTQKLTKPSQFSAPSMLVHTPERIVWLSTGKGPLRVGSINSDSRVPSTVKILQYSGRPFASL